jgi:formyl-CoA transferase
MRPDGTRAARVEELDKAIAEWTSRHTVAETLEVLDAARVPSGRIYTIEDIVADPQYQAREMLLRTRTQAGLELDVPGIVPKLLGTPGALRLPAPRLGQHTDEVLQAAGYAPEEIESLRSRGIVQ